MDKSIPGKPGANPFPLEVFAYSKLKYYNVIRLVHVSMYNTFMQARTGVNLCKTQELGVLSVVKGRQTGPLWILYYYCHKTPGSCQAEIPAWPLSGVL